MGAEVTLEQRDIQVKYETKEKHDGDYEWDMTHKQGGHKERQEHSVFLWTVSKFGTLHVKKAITCRQTSHIIYT